MKITVVLSLMGIISFLGSCITKQTPLPIIGTWELISATSTQQDSTFSTYNPKQKMIKIINSTHFAFLNHDIRSQKDSSTTPFSAGGGRYTLADSVYTEHLDYFIDKAWENNTFQFIIKISNDTLSQKGIERVEKLGVDRIITEKYKRVTN